MVNASSTLPRWPPAAKRVEYLEKSMNRTSNIARPSTTNRTAMAEVEPRRRVDRAERAGGQDDDEPEDAVDDRHGGAVGGAKQEPPAARLRLRAGADDRQVDRDHRQDARGQVEREAPEQHEKQNRERARPSNRPRGLTPASASRMNARKADVPWYPPVVPAIVKPSSSAAIAPLTDGWWHGLGLSSRRPQPASLESAARVFPPSRT